MTEKTNIRKTENKMLGIIILVILSMLFILWIVEHIISYNNDEATAKEIREERTEILSNELDDIIKDSGGLLHDIKLISPEGFMLHAIVTDKWYRLDNNTKDEVANSLYNKIRRSVYSSELIGYGELVFVYFYDMENNSLTSYSFTEDKIEVLQ